MQLFALVEAEAAKKASDTTLKPSKTYPKKHDQEGQIKLWIQTHARQLLDLHFSSRVQKFCFGGG